MSKFHKNIFQVAHEIFASIFLLIHFFDFFENLVFMKFYKNGDICLPLSALREEAYISLFYEIL